MRKVIALFLSLGLIFSMGSFAYAGDEDSKSLEKAILAVKQIIDIPENLTEFNYSTYEYNRETSGTVWNLNWSDPDPNDNRYMSIRASVDWTGQVNSYEKYVQSDESGLAKVSRDAALNTAKSFIKKALPEYADKLREIDREKNITNNYGHYFTFAYYVDDIPYTGLIVNMRIDKYSGEAVYFSGPEPGFTMPDFPDSEGILTFEEAKEAYLTASGIELNYHSNYDYRKKTLNIFPAYRVFNPNMAIDAKTGETVIISSGYDLYRMNQDASNEKVMNGAGGEVGLTKEEQEAVEKLGGLKSKEQASEIIKNMVKIIPSDSEILSASLRQDMYDKERFTWDISFDSAYGSIDAKTGELLSFSYYGEREKDGKKISYEEAKNIGEAFLNKVAPDKLKNTKFTEGEQGFIIYEEVLDDPVSYSFRYIRQVKGIGFLNNSLSITVDRSTGQVIHYSNQWYEKAEFPSIEKVLKEEQIMDIMAKAGKYSLKYETVVKGETTEVSLVYSFEPGFRNALFDPFEGMRINRSGEVYKEMIRPDYTDIKGHWAEDIILELCENGYYLQEERFQPDIGIKQLDFFKYLYTSDYSYYQDEDFYKMLIRSGILKEDEKAPDKSITRREAAKYIVRYLGLGPAGEHPEIFINPFKDKISTEYKGYAALCYGLEIMKGDKLGRFNGDSIMTRSEAAVSIYNLLKTQKK